MDDYQGAINDYTMVIKLNPKDEDAFFNRGLMHDNLKEYDLAIADYSESIKLKPQGDAYYNRGCAKHDSGDKVGACQDWKKAASMGYSKAETYIFKYCK